MQLLQHPDDSGENNQLYSTYNTSNTCVNGYFTKNEADITSVPYHIHVHNVMYYICNIDRKCS